MMGAQTVIHTATLHRPHVDTHHSQDFVDTNITGTLNLLEHALAASVESFVFTSTSSVFGDALVPPAGSSTAWITEEVKPIPKNTYGVTKAAADDMYELFYKTERLPCIVLRVSRFFPEEGFDEEVRETYTNDNMKVMNTSIGG
jgi:nucleoside-diphosphate-sugar epimerase